MRLGAHNLFTESSQITADVADPFYPISNLADLNTFREYRSPSGDTTAVLTIDTLVANAIDSIFIRGNVVTGELALTQVVVKANATDEWSSPAYSQTYNVTTSNQVNNFIYIPIDIDPATYQFWRLEISNAGGDYVGFSNLFIGESAVTNAGLDIDNGWTFENEPRSEIQKGRYGQQFIDIVRSTRVYSLAFTVLNTAEFDEIHDIVEYCDTYRPLWLIVDEANTDLDTDMEDFAGYFLIKDSVPREVPFHGTYNLEITIEEIV